MGSGGGDGGLVNPGKPTSTDGLGGKVGGGGACNKLCSLILEIRLANGLSLTTGTGGTAAGNGGRTVVCKNIQY